MPIPTKDDFIAILNHHFCREIHFVFNATSNQRIEVNRTTFQRIIDQLQNNHISVTAVERNQPAGFGAMCDAAYNQFSNSFKVSNIATVADPGFQGLVVHESVHASFDVTRSVIPQVDNEAAAHLAQAIFLRKLGYRAFHANFQPLRVAMEISDSAIRSGHIPLALIDRLRDTLRSTFIYQNYINNTFEGNG